MPDNKRKVAEDRRRVGKEEESSWAKRLGITLARLRAIKRVVGDSAKAIRAHLRGRKGPRRAWKGPLTPVKRKVAKRTAKVVKGK